MRKPRNKYGAQKDMAGSVWLKETGQMMNRLRTLLSEKLVLRIKQDRIEQSGATKISVYVCASVPQVQYEWLEK